MRLSSLWSTKESRAALLQALVAQSKSKESTTFKKRVKKRRRNLSVSASLLMVTCFYM